MYRNNGDAREAIAKPPRDRGASADLPPPSTTHWGIRKKAQVVAAVTEGLLSVEQACARYDLSLEEYVGWQRAVERHGLRGLRVAQIKQYR